MINKNLMFFNESNLKITFLSTIISSKKKLSLNKSCEFNYLIRDKIFVHIQFENSDPIKKKLIKLIKI